MPVFTDFSLNLEIKELKELLKRKRRQRKNTKKLSVEVSKLFMPKLTQTAKIL